MNLPWINRFYELNVFSVTTPNTRALIRPGGVLGHSCSVTMLCFVLARRSHDNNLIKNKDDHDK